VAYFYEQARWFWPVRHRFCAENDMRILVAFVIFVSAAYVWDAEYNYGKLSDGVRGMGGAILHGMGH
jgi:hypothetical protein